LAFNPTSLRLSARMAQRFGDYNLKVGPDGQRTGELSFTRPPMALKDLAVEYRPADAPSETPWNSAPMALHSTPTGSGIWKTTTPVDLNGHDLDYRFKATDLDGKAQTLLDNTYTIGKPGSPDAFNRIMANEQFAPHKTGPFLNLVQSSVMPAANSRALEASRDPYHISRNHFNDYRTGQPAFTNLKGMVEFMDGVEKNNYKNLLLLPVTGGDPSSHGYWSSDLLALNPTTDYDPRGFRQLVGQTVRRDMKLYSDVSTNMGLVSLPMWSNMLYGMQSPSWNTFLFDREAKFSPFPKVLTDDKLSIGMLPTKIDTNTGLPQLAAEKVGVQIINPPNKDGKFDREPYIRFYPADIENPDGTLKPHDKNRGDFDDPIRKSNDSIYKFRFPVPPKLLTEKLKHLKDDGIVPKEVNGQLVFNAETAPKGAAQWQNALTGVLLEYPHFRFTTPDQDNCGMKWHGQANAVKLNLLNDKTTRDAMAQSIAYSARTYRNDALGIIANGLAAQQQAQPQATGADWVSAITTAKEGTLVKDRASHELLAPVSQQMAPYEAPEVIAAKAETLKDHPDFKPVAANRVAATTAETLVEEVPIGVVPLRKDDGYPLLFKTVIETPTMEAKLNRPKSPVAWVGMAARNLVSMALLSPGGSSPLRSFEGVLDKELKTAIKTLPDAVQETLRTPLAQSVAMGQLGPDLYTYLLTGKTNADGQKAVEDGFYQTVPATIRNADPLTGSQLVQGFLKKRLQTPEARQFLAEHLATSLHTHDEHGVASSHWLNADALRLAKATVDNREIGLNLRLDAAKEVADTDIVNNKHGMTRKPLADEQMAKAFGIWKELLTPSRAINPNMTVAAEWTNDTAATGYATDYFNDALTGKKDSPFDSMLNFRYAYARIQNLANRLPRYDGFDNEGDLSVSRAMNDAATMTKVFPRSVVNAMVNMASIHDNESLTQNGLINAGLRESDYINYRGFKDHLADSLMELTTKAPWDEARSLVSEGSLPEGWQQSLKQWSYQLDKGSRDQQVKDWIDQADQLTVAQKEDMKSFAINSDQKVRPKDVSVAFTELAFNPNNGVLGNLHLSSQVVSAADATYKGIKATCILPTIQGVAHPNEVLDARLANPATWEPLEHALTVANHEADIPKVKSWLTLKALAAGRVAESSQTKTARAVLSNALEDKTFPWKAVLADKDNERNRNAVKSGLYQAFNWMAALEQRATGELPLQAQFNRMIDDPRGMTLHLQGAGFTELAHDSGLKDRLTAHLHSHLLAKVLPKVETAIQLSAVMPGQPSNNAVMDLLGQTGSERYTNDHMGNRQLAPLHFLKDAVGASTNESTTRSRYFTPEYQKQFDEFQTSVQQALSVGDKFPALRDGFSVPLHEFKKDDSPETVVEKMDKRLNQDGVFIMPRSNEHQTVIALVNTKKPTSMATSWYSMVGRIGRGDRYPEIKLFKPEVKNLSVNLKPMGLPAGSEFVSYHDNDPAKGVDHRYTLQADGTLPGLNFRDMKVLELAKVPALKSDQATATLNASA
jgi:hypothetical protein